MFLFPVATSASLEPDLCVGEACKCGPGMTGVQPFCVAIVDATAAPPAPTQTPTLVYAALPSNVSESNVVVGKLQLLCTCSGMVMDLQGVGECQGGFKKMLFFFSILTPETVTL